MEKQRCEESERRRKEVRRSERRKSKKKEGAGARKGLKVAIHCVLPIICGSEWSKSRLPKAAGAEPSSQMKKMKNCTPLWREARFQVKRYKAHHVQYILEVEMSKKWTRLWREAHFQFKSVESYRSRSTFGS